MPSPRVGERDRVRGAARRKFIYCDDPIDVPLTPTLSPLTRGEGSVFENLTFYFLPGGISTT